MGIDGFDDLRDELEEIEKEIEDIDGSQMTFTDLFPPKFMRRYTDANDIDEFFENSLWDPETEEEFDAIPETELDRYVDSHSRFRTWEQMKGKAGEEWLKQQLNF